MLGLGEGENSWDRRAALLRLASSDDRLTERTLVVRGAAGCSTSEQAPAGRTPANAVGNDMDRPTAPGKARPKGDTGRKGNAGLEGTAPPGPDRSSNPVFAAATKVGDREREEQGTLVVIGGGDSELVERATALGLAHQLASGETLEDAIALALKQVQELARLRSLSARVAQVERAKGILMERHKISEREAHEQLRNHARKLNLRLTAVAQAIENSYVVVPLEEA